MIASTPGGPYSGRERRRSDRFGRWGRVMPDRDGYRVAIVEDHRLQRNQTIGLVTGRPGYRVVFSGETLLEFLIWCRGAEQSTLPQLLVLDLQVDRGPSADPTAVRRLIRSGLRVVVVDALSSPKLVRDILAAGVTAVVSKRDPEESIHAAIDAALRGEEWMTPELSAVISGDARRPRLSLQEERALALYTTGITMDEVAAALGVKHDTAKQYINRVKAKYAATGEPVSTKLDLHRVATRDGYIPSSE